MRRQAGGDLESAGKMIARQAGQAREFGQRERFVQLGSVAASFFGASPRRSPGFHTKVCGWMRAT